jgi:hypothetical protein
MATELEIREFDGRSIVRRKSDAYFNATTMMPPGRSLYAFTKRVDAKVLLKQHPSETLAVGRKACTWFHPVVAQSLAKYLSSELDEFIQNWIAETPAGKVTEQPDDTQDKQPPAEVIVPELVDLPSDLAKLLGRSALPQVRKVSGKDNWVIADIGAAFLDKNIKYAGEDLKRIITRFPESQVAKCDLVLFRSNGRQPVSVKVGDLSTVIEYIFLLPGTTAARIRAEAARLLVRYLGGDLDIVDRVLLLPHVREHLQRCENSSDANYSPMHIALAAVLSKAPEDLIVIRTVGNTVRNQPTPENLRGAQSVIDIVMNITGQDRHDAAQTIRNLSDKFTDVGNAFSNFQFEGQGQRETPVARLATIVEIIMLLPGRIAALIRKKCAEVFVRYLGGDLTLIGEVQQIRHVQDHLKEVDPDNWRRVFGEAVENDTPRSLKSYPKPPELTMPQKQFDLYIMRVTDGSIVFWKIGRSDDPLHRASQLFYEIRRSRNKEWNHVVSEIYQGHGDMEPLLHNEFKHFLVPDTTEYFQDCDDFLDKVREAVQRLHPVQLEIQRQKQRKASDVFDEPEDFKRRRVEIELSTAELNLEQKRVEVDQKKVDIEQVRFRLNQSAEDACLLRTLVSNGNDAAIAFFLAHMSTM